MLPHQNTFINNSTSISSSKIAENLSKHDGSRAAFDSKSVKISTSAISLDREMVRRAREFDAHSWLKGEKFSIDAYLDKMQLTINKPSFKAKLAFTAPTLDTRIQKFISEAEFEGLVLDIEPERMKFWARLVDATGQFPDEEGEFNMLEITVDDWPLIKVGALFSWNIGLEIRNGQMRRVAEVRFRRFYQFSKDAIAAAESRADELVDLLTEINDSKYPSQF